MHKDSTNSRNDVARLERLRHLVAESPHPMCQVNSEGVVVECNAAGRALLRAWGGEPDGAAPHVLRELAAAAREQGGRLARDVMVNGRPFGFTAVPGSDGLVDLHAHDRVEGSTAVPLLVVPPSMGRKMEAGRDALTGLPSRDRLVAELGVLAARGGSGAAFALMKVNIDNCREINGIFGRGLGDRVIRLIAECIGDHVGDGDMVCRDAGDEFLVLLVGGRDREGMGTLCDALLGAVQRRTSAAGLNVPVSLSIGFAVYPEDAESTDRLMELANLALAEAKQSGRGCWRDFTAAARTNPLIRGSHLGRRLIDALQHRKLQAHFQPLISARDEAVAGFEALARWEDVELGWVSPQHFIPVAEARGWVVELGRQIAVLALDELVRWRNAGHVVGVSLNVAKRSLLEPGYVEEMRAMVGERGLESGWITLEATESQSVLNDSACREALERASAAGFLLALDDFGSGHSSFDMVAELPFHELKIDMSLGRKARTPRGRRIVQAVLEMCHTLEVESVVEGIEDAHLAEVVRGLGATRLQGYHYGRPMAPEAAREFLERRVK